MLLSLTVWIALVSPECKPCSCLQRGVRSADVVTVPMNKPGRTVRPVTVGDKLKQLKARCKRGKLFDSHGKQIYFYRLVGCWGNPPADYRDTLQRQNEELQKLRKQYNVTEMTCNPSGETIQ